MMRTLTGGRLSVEHVRPWTEEQAEAVRADDVAAKTANNALGSLVACPAGNREAALVVERTDANGGEASARQCLATPVDACRMLPAPGEDAQCVLGQAEQPREALSQHALGQQRENG